MSLNAQIIDQRVRRLSEDLRERLVEEVGIRKDETPLRSAAFVFLVTKTVLDMPDDAVLDCIVEGGGDFGVDAIYVAPPQDGEVSITLIQGKYAQSLDGNRNFPENSVRSVIGAIGALFDPGRPINPNPRLRTRVEEVRSLVAEGNLPQIQVVLSNNGLPWPSSAQTWIDQAGFGNQVSWKHIGPDELVGMLQSTQPVKETMQLTGQAVVENFDFRRALVGRMAVGQLAALFDRQGDRLLERNVRRYLGLRGNRVNEAMAATLRTPDQRPNFYFYNNGITMICTQFRYNALQRDNWQVQIDGLQIVNGGQTSKTIQQVLHDTPDAAEAQVMVRLYELPDGDADLVQGITYATNSQNPVDLRDLRANDERQKRLGLAIESLGDFRYRPQRSAQPVGPQDVTSAMVADAVLAVWRRRPHQARFMAAEHFGKLYDLIFSEDLNAAQAIIATLLLRFTEAKRKRPPPDAPDYLPYASRVIAMLMGHALLKDIGARLLTDLDHRRFDQARASLEAKGDAWFDDALQRVREGLTRLYGDQPLSLQRLSAAFRRGELIEALLGVSLAAPVGRLSLADLGLDR